MGNSSERHYDTVSWYSFQFCSPTRSSLQSGRYPSHVNDKNLDVTVHNPADPISGFAAIPRNMTGIASKLKLAGYRTHQVGKWCARPSPRLPTAAPASAPAPCRSSVSHAVCLV